MSRQRSRQWKECATKPTPKYALLFGYCLAPRTQHERRCGVNRLQTLPKLKGGNLISASWPPAVRKRAILIIAFRPRPVRVAQLAAALRLRGSRRQLCGLAGARRSEIGEKQHNLRSPQSSIPFWGSSGARSGGGNARP